MTDASTWFAAHAIGAPPTLRVSAADYLAQVRTGQTIASQLAAAAALALHDVVDRDSTRAAALALLTADSLVTLALLAQAEAAPAVLEQFAADIVGGAAA